MTFRWHAVTDNVYCSQPLHTILNFGALCFGKITLVLTFAYGHVVVALLAFLTDLHVCLLQKVLVSHYSLLCQYW